MVPFGDEYWLNGVTPWLYPNALPGTHDPCATGSQVTSKSAGTVIADPNAGNTFGAFTVYDAATCTAYREWGVDDEFKRRISAQLAATESWAVGREFEQGLRVPSNPYLAKAGATIAGVATAVTPRVGLGQLERAIANTGRAGVIHAPVEIVTAWATTGQVFHDSLSGQLQTTAKLTPVVCDSGYQGVPPSDQSANTGTQLCAYATGSIDIYRTEMFLNPEDIAEALDRSSNTVVYRAERNYLYDYDATLLRAYVRIDWAT